MGEKQTKVGSQTGKHRIMRKH